MTLKGSVFLCAALLVGTSGVAAAQVQYPNFPPPVPYQPYAYGQVAPTPPAWSFDPYTSGLGPCPQRLNSSDPPCSEQMPPSYGQPSFWPTR